jgi:hypothetical protein
MTRRLAVIAALVILVGCSTPPSPSSAITRDRAIEIARQHVSFEPTSTEIGTDVLQGKQVWVVTFRRADGSHGGLGQFVQITVERSTGEVLTIAMS